MSLYQRKVNEGKICNPDPSIDVKYTGTRIDRQIIIDHDKILAIQLHLSICNKGNLITKFIKDETNLNNQIIPWNETLCNEYECFKLSRRKNFVLRKIEIFNPNEYIGGLFQLGKENGKFLKDSIDENFIPIGKLISDSIYNQWLELQKDSNLKVYHIPLLYTPDVESSLNINNDEWFKFISVNELYNYSIETKNLFKNSLLLNLNQIKNLVKNSNKKLKNLNNQLIDSRPIRKAIKSMNVSKTVSFLNLIFKEKINDLTNFRINKDEIDFNTLMVISQILNKDQFLKFLNNLNSIYSKFQLSEEMFHYPKLLQP